MSSPFPQRSFNSGELAPEAYARIDLERYGTGLALCSNFVPDPLGGISNRQGTEFVGKTKLQDGSEVRLVPFVPSASAQYVLEFGHLYLRIYRDGAQLGVTTGNGPFVFTPTEVVTPYTSAELAALNFAQSVDVMTIVHPSHSPMELKHLSETSWTLDPLTNFPNVGEPFMIAQGASLAGTPTRDWEYAVSGVQANGTESLPIISPVVHVGASISTANPQTILITPGTPVDHYNVYKGLNGTYGFVGTVKPTGATVAGCSAIWSATYASRFQFYKAAGSSDYDASVKAGADANAAQAACMAGTNTTFLFMDGNLAPDYTDQPRQAVNDFLPPGANSAGLMPAVAAYFQQRLAFANVQGKPDTMYLSEVADYKNFQRMIPTTPDDAIIVTLASSGLNDIRALLSLQVLFVFTSGAVYALEASQGPVTPDNIDVAPVSNYGIGLVPPLVIGGVVLMKDVGGHVREFIYDFYTKTYPAQDVSILASHLFVGRTIKEWCYVSSPRSIVWAVMSDGALLSFTYVREQSVAGWARHSTDGLFKSCCTVRESGSEGETIYLVADRTLNGTTVKCIERMRTREPIAGPFADSSIKLQTPSNLGDLILATPSGSVSSVTFGALKGNYLRVTCPSLTLDPSLVGFVWFRMYGPDGTRVDGKLVAIESLRGFQPHTFDLEISRDMPAGLQAPGDTTSNWNLAQLVWGPFAHLIGEEVAVRADGAAHRNLVVDSSGNVTLDYPAVSVIVGLPYESEMNTLPLANAQVDIRGKAKTFSSLSIDVNATQGFFYGEKGGTLREWKQRALQDAPSPSSERAYVTLGSKWKVDGSIVMKQTYPLPCQILSVTPEVTVGG